MTLPKEKRKELYQAILDAFPTNGDLDRLVQFSLGENPAVAAGNNLADRVSNLLTRVESQNQLVELIEGAHVENARNPKLNKFYASWKAASPPNDDKISASSPATEPVSSTSQTQMPNVENPFLSTSSDKVLHPLSNYTYTIQEALKEAKTSLLGVDRIRANKCFEAINQLELAQKSLEELKNLLNPSATPPIKHDLTNPKQIQNKLTELENKVEHLIPHIENYTNMTHHNQEVIAFALIERIRNQLDWIAEDCHKIISDMAQNS
jgi:Effector-associated domain 1